METLPAFRLTPREREYLRMHKSGLSFVQIAKDRHLGGYKPQYWVARTIRTALAKIQSQKTIIDMQRTRGQSSLNSARGHNPGVLPTGLAIERLGRKP